MIQTFVYRSRCKCPDLWTPASISCGLPFAIYGLLSMIMDSYPLSLWTTLQTPMRLHGELFYFFVVCPYFLGSGENRYWLSTEETLLTLLAPVARILVWNLCNKKFSQSRFSVSESNRVTRDLSSKLLIQFSILWQFLDSIFLVWPTYVSGCECEVV